MLLLTNVKFSTSQHLPVSLQFQSGFVDILQIAVVDCGAMFFKQYFGHFFFEKCAKSLAFFCNSTKQLPLLLLLLLFLFLLIFSTNIKSKFGRHLLVLKNQVGVNPFFPGNSCRKTHFEANQSIFLSLSGYKEPNLPKIHLQVVRVATFCSRCNLM